MHVMECSFGKVIASGNIKYILGEAFLLSDVKAEIADLIKQTPSMAEPG